MLGKYKGFKIVIIFVTFPYILFGRAIIVQSKGSICSELKLNESLEQDHYYNFYINN